MESRKSLKINAILNGMKGLLQVIFPLITFPYISRVLGVGNIGKYNFASSIVSYFLLLAALGIATYAIREGARIRNDRKLFNEFFSEIFSINIISTIVSYILLFICVTTVHYFKSYEVLIFILSWQIFFTTISVEWVYSVYEDYLFITIRSFFFQCLSLILVFLLVRTSNDLNKYAILSVVSSAGSGIINFIYRKKYCDLKLVFDKRLVKHLKPILILFGMAITVTVYVSSDITILGFLCGEFTVGIYSVSVKIYTVLKSILSAILIVSIPRLSALIGNGEWEEFNSLGNSIYKTFLTYIIPTITGVIILREQIITIISGKEYLEAVSSLALLSIALFVCIGAGFWSQCIMIPMKMEKEVFIITLASAITNIILNFILIPVWSENAAAFTTIIAEGFTFMTCMIISRKHVILQGMYKILVKIFIGCGGMIIASMIIKKYIVNDIIFIILVTGCSVIVYGMIEVLLKNEVLVNFISIFLRKMKKGSGKG